ncbi:hypothetical protein BD560DRAFT_398767 [Blakeslea trispora]|nr:hypothetical protein BD560DRAFT_398767 [Blakeslea trispora]
MRNVRREPLTNKDTLMSRIQEVESTVAPEDCRGWIRDSIIYWDKCLTLLVDDKLLAEYCYNYLMKKVL